MTMETEIVAAVAATNTEMLKKNKIQVSNTKKPLFFYVNLAKRYMQQHNEVELSALGMGTSPETSLRYFIYTNESVPHDCLIWMCGSSGVLPFDIIAITTVVTIAEILKNNGLATEKKVLTSTIGLKDETKGRLIQKARIEIVLGKTEKFDTLITAATTAPEAAADNEDAVPDNKDDKQTEAA